MPRLTKKRDEQGAVAPLVAILMVLVLVPLASLAIDIGYQRVAARDMQAVADVVAMDMARQLDGTKGNTLKNTDHWKDAVKDSLDRNAVDAVGDDLEVVSCNYDLDTLPTGKALLCATPGVYTPGPPAEFTSGGNDAATHVRVVTRTRVDYFLPIFDDDGWVTKVAYAEASDLTCLRISSYVADANLNDGALGPVLDLVGAELSLGALNSETLIGADVSLLKLLKATAGAGSVDEVLDTEVSLGEFYAAIAEALAAESGNTAVIDVLETLTVPIDLGPFRLGDLLALDTGGSAGADARINVFDLVSGGLIAANGINGLALDTEINTGLVNADVSAHVVQRPQIGCGRRKSTSNPMIETAQVAVDMSVDVPLASGTLDLLTDVILNGLGPVGDLLCATLGTKCTQVRALPATVSVDFHLEVAPAKAKLTGVECVGPGRKVYVSVAGGELLELTVTANVTIPVQHRTRTRSGISWPAWPDWETGYIGGPLTITTTPNGPKWTDHTIEIDDISNDAAFDLPQKYGNSSIGLPEFPAFKTDDFGVFLGEELSVPVGSLVPVVLGPIKAVVDPILGSLDSEVLNPVLLALGVDVSGARLSVLRTPSCGYPALRG